MGWWAQAPAVAPAAEGTIGSLGFRVFSLIGFIRTLYTNSFQRVPKANQDRVLRKCFSFL